VIYSFWSPAIGDQYVLVCKISGLGVQRLRFVTLFKVTDRQTHRQTVLYRVYE